MVWEPSIDRLHFTTCMCHYITIYYASKSMYLHNKTAQYDKCSQLWHLFFFQRELDDVVSVWGNHKVRPTRQGVCPHGRPEVLYHCPELYGAMDYACQVSIAAIEAMRDVCQFPELSVDADFVELVQILRQDNHWIKPSIAHEAVIQYLHMRHILFQWS